ncbi:Hypothetical predicted protein [Mytilus galloprovincialis]|uniref:Carrier domain-containing protein n=1 Tax=Mytilus galloprovincialis TaxID=29158 RepID=A0A8B6D729_MYTGA|nr:Hypothetical predicted protein [Mytilus galloprovincialis]
MDALKTRKFCPVGNILPGVNLVIMDKDQKIQPVGASGEIFVGGPTLAHGYLNRPEVQALRFIPLTKGVQTSHGDRLYRTGDWGYMLSDGRLEICGRCDSMVKIRGYSIEVQAVESALMELPMVNACVVLVEGQEGEDKFLVSYIVPEGQTTKKDIRAILKLRLPYYMIPSYFVFLQSIPMVETTGKLDKKALPNFDKEHESDSVTIAAPNTDTEKKVAVVWCKVLKIQDIDIQDSFFDLGGHSLLATELMMNLRQMFDVDLNVRDLFTYPTITTLSQFIEAKKNKRTEELHTIPKVSINLQTDVNRHDPRGIINIDMQLRAFWRTFNLSNERRFKIGRVLLTGATGFLGAFLLREILLQTKCMIKCLVRELPDTTPNQRLEKSLQQFGVLPSDGKPSEQQTLIQSMYTKRVEIIKGDVALINMGMNEDDYTYLCTDIDFIIHAAAYVNLVYPYEAFTGPNVTGTRNVVMFSCTGKIKPIHYISTDAVFPNGMKNCSEDDNIEDNHTELNDGYSQSKWVAEQLISRAGQKGLPVVIYRLGNMSGDRKQAFWNPQDFTLLVLQACAKYGYAPDVDWNMEMTPVDFAAEFIVRCTFNLSTILGKTYHIINDQPLHSRWVFEWMHAHGYPLKIVPFRAGSAGSVVATRLSEDYDTSVLLLEAGMSDLEPDDVTQIPSLWGSLIGSEKDWGYHSVQQKYSHFAYENERAYIAQGKVLGGSSSINAQNIVRGSRNNYDQWEHEGAVGWGYDDVLPFFRKLENATDTSYGDSTLRGLHGPINIKETTGSILQSFHQTAAKEIGFPTVDCNSDDPIGFCKNQMNVKDGKRCSTSTCYLRPALERHNLQVSLRSRVTKVLIRSNKAVGVEFIKDGKRRRILAKHEVILSAGFISSAQILMLSGIGPRKHLQQMKIPLKVDLPVGQNLYDHLLFAVQYNITAPLNINNKKASEPDRILEYIFNREGK